MDTELIRHILSDSNVNLKDLYAKVMGGFDEFETKKEEERMKARVGFVSNSSSSSFVLIGTPVKREKMEELFGEDYYEAIEDSGFDYLGEEDLFGILIAHGTDDGYSFPELSLSIEEISEKAQQVANKLGVDVSSIKILTGVMAC